MGTEYEAGWTNVAQLWQSEQGFDKLKKDFSIEILYFIGVVTAEVLFNF